jgi:hypothetical protein
VNTINVNTTHTKRTIGIIGSGIAGLQLGLFLQQHDVDVTLYSDRTSKQMLEGRLPNLVIRFEQTRRLERELGIDDWDFDDFGVYGVHMYVGVQPPMRWHGSFKQPASAVDMRIYQARLLDEFARCGGRIRVGAVSLDELTALSAQHDLTVVASGGGKLTELFPRLAESSPCRGITFPNPLGAAFTLSPGNGEIFQAPFHALAGRVSSLLIEGIPGQAFEPIMGLSYADDPRHFEHTVLDLLRDFAPELYQRVDLDTFGVTRPQDVLQGAITPTVRRGYARLANGNLVLALGDLHILNDPILAQGANLAARAARLLGEALLSAPVLDEGFCREIEQRLWEAGRATTLWTNAMLQPPPPHALALLEAAAQNQAIADEMVENFNRPEAGWEIFGSPEGAQRYLEKHAVAVI